jgi:hypothetical protein
VTFANGTFVAVGGSGVITSTNGMEWDYHSVPTPGGSFPLQGVSYGNGTFVAVGGMYSFGDPQTGYIRWRTVYTSPDARQWTQRVEARMIPLRGVTFGNGLFVAVGSEAGAPGASPFTVTTSPDGVTWTTRFTGSVPNVPLRAGVTFGGGRFVAAGYGIFTSDNGIDWDKRDSANVSDVAYGNGLYVAVGQQGIVVSSTDGLSWRRGPNTGGTFLGIGYGGGVFLASALSQGPVVPDVRWSLDGINWSRHNLGQSVQDVAFGKGRFVAVSAFGPTLFSSPIASFRAIEATISNGRIRLPFDSVPGFKVDLEASTNLVDWTVATTQTNVTGQIEFENPIPAGSSGRFYRARLEPLQ